MNGYHTMECYSPMRKKEILLFVKTWTELEGIMLSELSDRGRYILYGICVELDVESDYMWNLKMLNL